MQSHLERTLYRGGRLVGFSNVQTGSGGLRDWIRGYKHQIDALYGKEGEKRPNVIAGFVGNNPGRFDVDASPHSNTFRIANGVGRQGEIGLHIRVKAGDVGFHPEMLLEENDGSIVFGEGPDSIERLDDRVHALIIEDYGGIHSHGRTEKAAALLLSQGVQRVDVVFGYLKSEQPALDELGVTYSALINRL